MLGVSVPFVLRQRFSRTWRANKETRRCLAASEQRGADRVLCVLRSDKLTVSEFWSPWLLMPSGSAPVCDLSPLDEHDIGFFFVSASASSRASFVHRPTKKSLKSPQFFRHKTYNPVFIKCWNSGSRMFCSSNAEIQIQECSTELHFHREGATPRPERKRFLCPFLPLSFLKFDFPRSGWSECSPKSNPGSAREFLCCLCGCGFWHCKAVPGWNVHRRAVIATFREDIHSAGWQHATYVWNQDAVLFSLKCEWHKLMKSCAKHRKIGTIRLRATITTPREWNLHDRCSCPRNKFSLREKWWAHSRLSRTTFFLFSVTLSNSTTR